MKTYWGMFTPEANHAITTRAARFLTAYQTEKKLEDRIGALLRFWRQLGKLKARYAELSDTAVREEIYVFIRDAWKEGPDQMLLLEVLWSQEYPL